MPRLTAEAGTRAQELPATVTRYLMKANRPRSNFNYHGDVKLLQDDQLGRCLAKLEQLQSYRD